MHAILRKIKAGTPYVGWSAGSNLPCPTLCTTHAMRIVQPESFRRIRPGQFPLYLPYPGAHPSDNAHAPRTPPSARG